MAATAILNPIEVLNPSRYWEIGDSKTSGTDIEKYYVRKVKAWDVSLGNTLDVSGTTNIMGITNLKNLVNITGDTTLTGSNFTINSPNSVVDIDANLIDLNSANFSLNTTSDFSINNAGDFYLTATNAKFNASSNYNITVPSFTLDSSNIKLLGSQTNILSDQLTISGPTSINNTLTVDNVATFKNQVDLCNNLSVQGTSIFNDTVTINGKDDEDSPNFVVSGTDVCFNQNLYLGGTLYTGTTFYIDPIAHRGGRYDPSNQDSGRTGKVVIRGDLQVEGVQTTVNSTTVDISDRNLTLASNASTKSELNYAGIDISSVYSFKINQKNDDANWVISGAGLSIPHEGNDGYGLHVVNNSIFEKRVDIDGALDICGILTATNNVTFSGTDFNSTNTTSTFTNNNFIVNTNEDISFNFDNFKLAGNTFNYSGGQATITTTDSDIVLNSGNDISFNFTQFKLAGSKLTYNGSGQADLTTDNNFNITSTSQMINLNGSNGIKLISNTQDIDLSSNNINLSADAKTNITSNSLNVNATSTFNNNVTINSDLIVSQDISGSGNLTIGGSNVKFSGIEGWGNDKYIVSYDSSGDRLKLVAGADSVVSARHDFINNSDLSTDVTQTDWVSLENILSNDISFNKSKLTKNILVCVKFNYFHSIGFGETMDIKIQRKAYDKTGNIINSVIVAEDFNLGSSNATGGTKSVYSTSFIDEYTFGNAGVDTTEYNRVKYYVEYKFPNVQSSTQYYNSKLGIVDLPTSTPNYRKSASIDLHVL